MTQSLKPKQLRSVLAQTIANRYPVLITGAPGVGKSDIVAQAALDAGAEVILSHPAVADPTDAKGLPWPAKDGEHATFLPFGELARALKAEKPTVWFLDDLGQATPAVQASFMQLLLARRVNGHMLPECVTFIAATNRRTDRAGVSGILEPVKSRFTTILNLEPSLDDWCEWAYANNVAPEIIAFLRFRPELLHKFEPSTDMGNSPCPRTWSSAAKIARLKLTADVELSAYAGAVGDGAASEFISFLRVFRDLPNPDDVLLHPDSAPIPKELSALYALSVAIAARATTQNFGAVARYAVRLKEHQHGEFGVLMVWDACRKERAVMNTPEFSALASTELGELLMGAT